MTPEVERRLTQAERDFLHSRSLTAPTIYPEKPKGKTLTCISGKVTRYVEINGVLVVVGPDGRPKRRPVTQRYVDGYVREVYLDTGELVPSAAYRTPLRSASPAKRQKGPASTPPLLKILVDRDKGCVRCGTVAELTKHHVVHRSNGGSNDLSNLQTLCKSCHAFVHEVLELPSGTPYLLDGPDAMEAEHAAFDAYQRERSARKQRTKHYEFGKDLATNMAAPFVVRLRAELSR